MRKISSGMEIIATTNPAIAIEEARRTPDSISLSPRVRNRQINFRVNTTTMMLIKTARTRIPTNTSPPE
ncbi:MAG: hypothetical protein HQM09_14545 [Candidatus Riflebacteria bacterium]|nr:hypothetical protein [Candidatus Riflebacteria bacterium]